MDNGVQEKEQKKRLIESLLLNKGYAWIQLQGNSMLPVIDSMKKKIKIMKSDGFSKGDIVALYCPGAYSGFIVHRIIKITEKDGKRFYWIKGDNNQSVDGKFSAESILGKITETQWKQTIALVRGSRKIAFASRIENGLMWFIRPKALRFLLHCIFYRIIRLIFNRQNGAG